MAGCAPAYHYQKKKDGRVVLLSIAVMICPICASSFPDPPRSSFSSASNNSAFFVERPCCKQKVCRSCLYRHVRSIVDEAAAGGRRVLACPFGCGRDISDADVRESFRRCSNSNSPLSSAAWEFVGGILYRVVTFWLARWCHPSRRSTLGYRYWWYLRHTEAERADLLRYEAWSRNTAFAEMTKKNDGDDPIVEHCPAPDCDYAWLVANPSHRRYKRLHESKPVFLFYSPPKFEAEKENWAEADYLNIDFDPYSDCGDNAGWFRRSGTGGESTRRNGPPEDTEAPTFQKDGRRMACGKCGFVFCGLCRQPWHFANRRHHGLSCSRYGRKLPGGGRLNPSDVYASRSTRACPNCHMRTVRIDGCNHMTCPCGMEYCYVCEVRWNPFHYGCVDGGRGDGCNII